MLAPRPGCGIFLATLVLASACHESSSSPPQLALVNLGVAAVSIQSSGDMRLLHRVERTDALDLNGDGDQDDVIASVYDRADGSMSDVPHAVAGIFGSQSAAFGTHGIALIVDEERDGATDWNGDGDALDEVCFFYDHRTGQAFSTGLAAMSKAIGDDWVVCVVSELEQGEQDLNGDGDADGVVLFAFDSFAGTSFLLEPNPLSSALANGDEFAFLVSETLVDLNGDGDATDSRILRLFDPHQGAVVEAGVSLVAMPLAVTGGWLGLVDEGAQGLDLDGDGDQADAVYHFFPSHAGTGEPLGFSLALSHVGARAHLGERFLVLPIEECDGRDHNGDGDEEDILWGIYDLLQGEAHETGIVRGFFDAWPAFLGDTVAIPAWEIAGGVDLDGDGLVQSFVLQLFRDGALENTGLGSELGNFALGAGRLVAVGRAEGGANPDWNGDGDREDRILHLLDLDTGALTNTRLASVGTAMSASRVLLLIDSTAETDGDDAVWFSYEVATGAVRSLGLTDAEVNYLEVSADGAGLLLVDEAQRHRDLNGDGDLEDEILFGFPAP